MMLEIPLDQVLNLRDQKYRGKSSQPLRFCKEAPNFITCKRNKPKRYKEEEQTNCLTGKQTNLDLGQRVILLFAKSIAFQQASSKQYQAEHFAIGKVHPGRALLLCPKPVSSQLGKRASPSTKASLLTTDRSGFSEHF